MSEPAFLSVDPKMLKSDERIIVAAMRIFADCPVEKASLRMIAKEAGISFSAITYYFKTKENLYKEVVTRILNYIVSASPDLGRELPKKMTSREAEQELRKIIRHFAERMYGNSNASLLARILFREHFSPSPIYEMIYEKYFKKIIDHVTHLVRVLCKKADDRRATLQAFSIIGQMIAFRLEREMIVRRLGFTGYSPDEIEVLKDVLEENIFRQLGVER